jgi:hypothetical protein
MEFQKPEYYDLMYTTTNGLDSKPKHGIKAACIEISKGNKIVAERQVVTFCENYIKAIPVQAWRGPAFSRRLTLPDFKTSGT